MVQACEAYVCALWCGACSRPQPVHPSHPCLARHLEYPDGLAHRALDVQGLYVLPVLFKQRDQEVDACENSCQNRKDEIRFGVDLLSITLPKTWSSVIWTCPTATPKHRTFLSWNLIVERTSTSLFDRSSEWETGVGNFPAVAVLARTCQRLGTLKGPNRNIAYLWKDRGQADEEFA